eukprot:scaffold11303_cov127-Skeletonema_dohrnii-CCMP3373.AAC.1
MLFSVTSDQRPAWRADLSVDRLALVCCCTLAHTPPIFYTPRETATQMPAMRYTPTAENSSGKRRAYRGKCLAPLLGYPLQGEPVPNLFVQRNSIDSGCNCKAKQLQSGFVFPQHNRFAVRSLKPLLAHTLDTLFYTCIISADPVPTVRLPSK